MQLNFRIGKLRVTVDLVKQGKSTATFQRDRVTFAGKVIGVGALLRLVKLEK